MPGKKKKYNARFPAGRIKKIMQTDEEVGKVAQAVPIIISRTLEMFVHQLLTKTVHITNTKQAKTLSPSHMKQCIFSEARFDFLRDIVKNVPDATGSDENVYLVAAAAAAAAPIMLPPPQPYPHSITSTAAVAPKTSTVVSSNVPKDGSSCAQIPVKLRSVEGDKTKLAEPAEGNKTVFTCDVPKSITSSVPTTFNASQPNFYTELNSSSSSDYVPKFSYSQSVSNLSCTANIDEDNDT
ncbi:DNA polymerase epsilon subunit C [Copidosoma floridanum]|uniref:DNA polymerase epsilon subunit C n=1 Tax=Copidosoma floridanum TaxID=29053 RepID=UPI0006C942CB|nr:DNA polymerase epsilon subunit C [Copidosoma floridanum]